MATMAIGSPEEIIEFSNILEHYIATLDEETGRMNSAFEKLGETWQDPQRASFEEKYRELISVIAQKVSPSVVGIRATASVNSFFGFSQQSSDEGDQRCRYHKQYDLGLTPCVEKQRKDKKYGVLCPAPRKGKVGHKDCRQEEEQKA